MASPPVIVYPSLGCPHGLQTTQGPESLVSVIACAPRDPFNAGGSPQARLLPVPEGVTEGVQLDFIDSGPAQSDCLPGVGRWAEWVRRKGTLWQARFRVPVVPMPIGRRCLLFDLDLSNSCWTVRRPGSVFLRNTAYNDVKVLHGTDVHVARRWDEIAEDVARVFPSELHRDARSAPEACRFEPEDALSSNSILRGYENPNRNLEEFIRIANALADAGLLDVVLLTGDLVDYKFARIRRESGPAFDDTEWSLLRRILLGGSDACRRLRLPVFTSTGNHDYRLYPYNLQIYGLRHCGVADETTLEMLRRTGQLRRVKYRLNDLDAITAERGEQHSLEFYYPEFCPFDDYVIDFGSARLVMLDSGPDVFCDFAHLRSLRRWRFLHALKNAISEPHSNGLDDSQLDFVQQQSFSDAPFVVITHAPPLNPRPSSIRSSTEALEHRSRLSLPSEGVAKAEDTRSQVVFEEEIGRGQLDSAILFRGQLRLLDILRRRAGAGVVLSGHTHWNREVSIDKATGEVSLSDHARRGVLASDRVTLLQTASIAHLKFDHLSGGVPGYRLLTMGPREVSSAVHHELHADWPPGGRVDWWVEHQGGEEFVTFVFLAANAAKLENPALFRRVVCWVRPTIKPLVGLKGAAGLSRMRIAPAEATNIVAHDIRIDGVSGHASFVIHAASAFKVQISGRPSGVRVAFLFEALEMGEGGVLNGLGLWRHHDDLA